MIPETKGTVAVFTAYPLKPGSPFEWRVPVIAWDAEGYALVLPCDEGSYRLVRVADRLVGMGEAWEFGGFDCPETQVETWPVIEIDSSTH